MVQLSADSQGHGVNKFREPGNVSHIVLPHRVDESGTNVLTQIGKKMVDEELDAMIIEADRDFPRQQLAFSISSFRNP